MRHPNHFASKTKYVSILVTERNPELADQICFEEYGTKSSITYKDLNSRVNKLTRVLIEKVNT